MSLSKPINCFRQQETLENCKISFPDKVNYGNKTTLMENGSIIDSNTDIAEKLKNFLKNATVYLNIQKNQYIVADVEDISDLIEKEIKKFEFHPGILLIQNKVDVRISQSFVPVK